MALLSAQAGFEVPDAVDPEAARTILREGDVDVVGRMPWSSNATFLARIDHVDGSLLGICKPQRGERALWDFGEGTLCLREVAACVLSELLGWELVPDTVLRDGPLGVGSVQRFYDHNPEDHYFELLEGRDDLFRRFALFDALANNTDRKGGHVVLAEDGHVWGIDHGVCFHHQWKLRTVIWEFAGEAISGDLLETVACARDRIASRDGPFGDLLASVEIDAIAARAERLLKTGRFPLATGDYHDYPWPMV